MRLICLVLMALTMFACKPRIMNAAECGIYQSLNPYALERYRDDKAVGMLQEKIKEHNAIFHSRCGKK